MSFESRKIFVPLWFILTASIIMATVLLGSYYYYMDPSDAKSLGLIGGIISGLIVYLATFITLLSPIRELDKFKRMGVKGLLANRHDLIYYRNLVAKSRDRVDVMGASCARFVQDFLDQESDDKILIEALGKYNNLKIRLLIPEDNYMSEHSQSRVRGALAKIEALRSAFGDRIELRRFPQRAHHSFVIVDNEVVAGPIFDEDNSRHAPAVHVDSATLFGQKYIRHFDTIWDAQRAN